MQRVNLDEAIAHLNDLVDAAVQGETVLIVTHDQQTVQLVPVPPSNPTRKFGSAAGMFTISDDFDAPLDDFAEYME
jgi:antitoxin (DNA-binding transcriptional repressor) of toxin-antitoxin stability system